MIPAPSEEVEGVIIVRVLEERTSESSDPASFVLPEVVQPPFPLALTVLSGNPTVCMPLRYNLGGLVAYECPTLPATSGALLTSKDSKPFAIHLGRKAGLGYGLVLGRIKNDILDALKSASAGAQP